MDLSLIPAGYPPAGVTPNFDNPTSLGPATIGIFGTLITLTVLAVSALVTFNFNSTRKLGADDICAIGALVFSVAQSAIVLSFLKTTRHAWDIPLSFFDVPYIKKVYAQNLLAWPAIFLAKVAILLLFRRIFHVNKNLRVAIWVGIIWSALTYLPNIFIVSYYCAPHIGGQWSFAVAVRCGEPLKWEIGSATMSIILDRFILVLPIPTILGLQLTQKGRVGLLFVFLTASFAVVCAILTLVYRIEIFLDHNGDAAWKTSQLYICNGAENYTAIIVGCVPGVSSFFKFHVADSRFYNSTASTFFSGKSGSRSISTTNKSNTTSASTLPKSKGNSRTQTTFGGTTYETDPGFGNSSTSHLQGFYELKDGKVTTDISGEPKGDRKSHGITKSVGMDQSSFHEEES